jgi:ribosomal-protein-serine acetyltransferase
MFHLVVDDETRLDLLEEQHAPELFALVERSRASLREWLPWLDQNTSVDQTRAFIRATLQRYASRNGFACGIRHKGALAGMVGLHAIDWPNRSTGLGYWLDEAQRGRGLVTRSCAVLIAHLFGDLGLHRVVVECAVGNVRSCAVPERLGFSREGLLRQREWLYDHFVDHVVYGMLSTEWSERRPT